MEEKDSLLVVDKNGNEYDIYSRNERAYFGRIFSCNCGVDSSFEGLPWKCKSCDNIKPKTMILRPCDWWNQQKLEHARVLIIGCGAIGNEIVKNLALLGVKNITLVDFDTIEIHNLSRSILFHEDARKKADSLYKVDVMKSALQSIDPKIKVTALKTGVLDNISLRKGRHNEWIDPPINRAKLIELGLQHDLCIVGTDGIAPSAFIAGVLYLVCPIVQTSMNGSGTVTQVRVSIPGSTGCIQCPTKTTPLIYHSDGEPNWSNFDTQYGANKCKDAAEAMSAASFAHTNSMAASYAVSQAILLLMGWDDYSKKNIWPKNIPLPLWNEVAKPRPLNPGGSRLENKTFYEELIVKLSPTSDPICFCCRKGFFDGGGLFERAIELMEIAEKNEIPLWFDDLEKIPRIANGLGVSRPDNTIKFG